MAVDFKADQYNTVSKIQNISATLLDQIALAKVIIQEAIDNGYASGGANALTDALLNGVGAPFPKLVAQNVFDAATWILNLDTTLGATSVTPTGAGRTGYKALERMRP